ncbi:SLC13 family permease [Robertmurraya kyonggiensis]|uniref:Sodium-dependent dicarboxylate transporter SdcS n=1 Tax=Robertmurraya kyonggiensis TaxID=1037680 RepID=A0A4U1DCW3_9BACI|nr:DASS family sodium-coupled anion symporter [Robertmurraya kyonggiensis]TKC19447.1 DASS family sodium-coupled anion symporter [Robertmurraya kyonggiensis]
MGVPKVHSNGTVAEKLKASGLFSKKALSVLLAILLFVGMYLGLPESFHTSARLMIGIVSFAIVLWALEPIPLGLTSIITIIFLLIFNVVNTNVVYSGFASPAVFLIIAGMMLARAVNETPLAKRMTYFLLAKWGGNAKGLLASILIIPQIQAFFIPAVAVRTALLLPIVVNVLDMIKTKPNSDLRKMIMLGVAFGSTVSGTAVMTAAIGNILAVELLNEFSGINITYFQWFLYALPIWLLLIPAVWILLMKLFPLKKEEANFPEVQAQMKERAKDFGRMERSEKRCLLILIFIVGLWMTEPLHGLHPSVPALIGVALMTLPAIGCATWTNVVKINFDTVLLLGATLSIGYALNESGATQLLGESLSADWIFSLMESPIIAVIFILCITQLFHLAMSNVSTAVVALIPIYIGLANQVGTDPLVIVFSAALACLHGYILVVEAMPNVLVHSTGQIKQQTFLLPGFYMTLIMTGITVIVALTWWQWLGLL